MRKLLSLLALVFFAGCCFAQQSANTKSRASYSGTLLTEIYKNGFRNTRRMLYVSNREGDSLAVYTATGAIIDEGMFYHLAVANDAVSLIAKPVDENEPADSLTIRFDDAVHGVLVNKDSYKLYPAYFREFKQAVLVKHSVMAVLGLLQDKLGDYPIQNVLPLLLFSPKMGTAKGIQQARVVTVRSQSDEVRDTWDCVYHYNKKGKLIAVIASADHLVYFSKNIRYSGTSISTIKYDRNIEDRQVTDGLITYTPGNAAVLKCQEEVLETGKTRETSLKFTLGKKALGPVKSMVMSRTEVLGLIK
jgi:hypothetical protein